nr:DNA helicase [Tanacetum cinerariifolium]
YDNSEPYHGMCGGRGRFVLDFESSSVHLPSVEEDSGDCGIFVSGSSFGSSNVSWFLPDDRYDCLFHHPNVDILSNIKRRSNVQLQYGKRCLKEQFVPTRSAMTDDIVSNNSLSKGVSSLYIDISDCQWSCEYFKAKFWYGECLKGYSKDHKIRYHKCCSRGKVVLEGEREPPEYIKHLLGDRHFLENIRAYNQMFNMTSFGARVDEPINDGRDPYVFKISGQIYHWIGTLCPFIGDPPRFCQLYIYDTENDVANRMRHFGGAESSGLNPFTVEGLMHLLDECNELGFHKDQKLRTAGQKKTYNEHVLYVPAARAHQADIRKDYLSGIYDAISRGDREGSEIVLYTIEFHKRGLPHCHTLLWVDDRDKIQHAANIDRYISAELPNPKTDPEGYRIISEMMVHGPCGPADPTATCMKENVCSKKFPKKFNNETFFDKDGYVHYHRRNTGVEVTRICMDLDNGYTVPYNQQLCLTFHVHINVEYCGWSMLIKYLFKYISKEIDMIVTKITRPIGESSEPPDRLTIHVDEIQNSVDGRFICPHEACWRILKFEIHSRYPAVQKLSVHLENKQLRNREMMEEKSYDRDELATEGDRINVPLEDNYKFSTPDQLFGGKSVILGGDFCQTLPVKKGAFKLKIVASSIAESQLWHHFKVCILRENMRLMQPSKSQEELSLTRAFAEWLLDIGNGNIREPDTADPQNSSWIHIPEAYSIHYDDNGISKLISFICDEHTLQNPTIEEL